MDGGDSDSDGVCDDVDVCPNADDTLDSVSATPHAVIWLVA